MQKTPPLPTILGASRSGNLITINALLTGGANVNGKNRNGTTALMIAAVYGHERAVELLLTRGARVDAVNVDGTTALMFAVRGQNVSCVRALLGAGADLNARDSKGATALDQAGSVRQAYIKRVLTQAFETVPESVLVRGA